MNFILNTILQEKKRIERMLTIYNGKLAMLPKGSICEREVGKSTYYYLKFRDGRKVVSKYIPREDLDHVRKQVEKRRHVEAMICSLQEELTIAQRAMEGHT